jgi:hypothetical protein
MSDDPRTPAEIEQDHAEEDVADEIYRERHRDEPTDDASARHCEIKIDGLPDQLPAGEYRVTFSGMEYRAGARPVIRFRYVGGTFELSRWPDPAPNEVYRTKTGKIITEAMIDGWVAEAERGYDIPDLYQVSTTEVLNVSKLAVVISELLRRNALTRNGIGYPHDVSSDPEYIESWLRA